MRQDHCANWEPLIDRLSSVHGVSSSGLRQLNHLPFAHFALPIPRNPSADTLHAMYLSLYRAAVKAAGDTAAGSNVGSSEGPAAISYNLALTESMMMICPRRNESAQIPVDDGDASDSGIVALNGTILAGTLMVKAEADWDELRNNQGNLTNVLATIGFPPLDSQEMSSL